MFVSKEGNKVVSVALLAEACYVGKKLESLAVNRLKLVFNRLFSYAYFLCLSLNHSHQFSSNFEYLSAYVIANLFLSLGFASIIDRKESVVYNNII